jgi:hypothetical protein
VALVLYGPLTFVGALLFFRNVGSAVTSASTGQAALKRIAEVGPAFRVMHAFLHLSPVLLIPGMVALYQVAARIHSDEALTGLVLGIVGVVVPLGWIYALNEGLYRLARAYPALGDGADAAGAKAAATMNLGTQAGGELLQSALLGAWALVAAISLRTAWPEGWLLGLGTVAGVAFIVSGLVAVLPKVPMLTPILAAVGTAGVFLFLAWAVAAGLKLLTII